jgi:hypothetical protein
VHRKREGAPVGGFQQGGRTILERGFVVGVGGLLEFEHLGFTCRALAMISSPLERALWFRLFPRVVGRLWREGGHFWRFISIQIWRSYP